MSTLYVNYRGLSTCLLYPDLSDLSNPTDRASNESASDLPFWRHSLAI